MQIQELSTHKQNISSVKPQIKNYSFQLGRIRIVRCLKILPILELQTFQNLNSKDLSHILLYLDLYPQVRKLVYLRTATLQYLQLDETVRNWPL